jgi:hypothetical protein
MSQRHDDHTRTARAHKDCRTRERFEEDLADEETESASPDQRLERQGR